MTETARLFERAVTEFGRRVQEVLDDQWSASTPCSDWDVRTLVNHLVNEDKWMPPLLEGKTIEDVGDAFDGDLLGNDPKSAWKSAAAEAVEASSREGVDERIVHLSFGDFPGHVYISQVLSDHVIHAWDLARGIGAEDQLDPELVEYVYSFLKPQAEAWRSAGAFGEAVEVASDADRQTQLLALAGRRA